MLDENEFNWKYKDIKRSYHCKECSRKYIRNHYLVNTEYYINKSLKRNKMIKNLIFNYLGSYFLGHPCIDCGENDILVLEFDHRIKSEKFKEINVLMKNRGSVQSIINEVEKCDVRCANCHRRKTSRETSSWRLNFCNKHP